MLKTTLTLSALYLAAVGLGLTFFPLAFGVGAVPPDASPVLVSLPRLLGGPFLGIAALNWHARKGEPSALGTVLLATLTGFGVVALNVIVGVATGDARDIENRFLILHVLFGLAFGLVARARLTRASDV